MNAQEFEIKFHRAMVGWLQGGKVGPDPRGEIETTYADQGCKWTHLPTWTPEFSDEMFYRWKPTPKRTVTISGVELVAPEVEEPKEKAEYFYEHSEGRIDMECWEGHNFDKKILAVGKLFLTRKDCQAMSDFQRNQRLGGEV